jgi:hypothetical protein
MTDHIDCWSEQVSYDGMETAVTKGNLWIGPLTDDQLSEVISRAEFYTDCRDYLETCPHLVRAAKSVLTALSKTEDGKQHILRLASTSEYPGQWIKALAKSLTA